MDLLKLLHKSVCLLVGLSLYRAVVAQFIRIPQHGVIKFTIVSLKKWDKFKNLWPKYPERRHIRIEENGCNCPIYFLKSLQRHYGNS